MRSFVCSPREWDVLVELCRDGATNRQIARRLFVTEDTVKTHMKHLLNKTKLNSRTELAVAVLRQDLAPSVAIPARAL